MTLLEWALTYARRGWPVFPCNPRNKRPLVGGDVGADGQEIPKSGGVRKATCDLDLITAWWTRWPKAMIGLACGPTAGLVVVDADPGVDKDTGEEFSLDGLIAALSAELGEADLSKRLAATWSVDTPRGGRHFYFAWPAGTPPTNRGGLIARWDVRSDGGYVILPPSVNSAGKGYTWRGKPVAKDDAPAAMPAALLACIRREGRWAEVVPAKPAARPLGPHLRGDERGPTAADGASGGLPLTARDAGDEAVARYAAAAFDAEIAEVSNCASGGRNHRLNLAALRLGELVAAGALTDDEVRTSLENAADACGLLKEDGARAVRATIDSGLRDGLKKPRDLDDVRRKAETRAASPPSGRPPEPPLWSPQDFDATLPNGRVAHDQPHDGGAGGTGRSGGKLPPGGGDDGGEDDDAEAQRQRALDPRLAFFPRTDLGNAERFAARWEGRLLYCAALGWLAWDGKRFRAEGAEGRVAMAVHDTVRAIQDEAEWLSTSDRNVKVGTKFKGKPDEEAITMADALAAFGRASEQAKSMSAIEKHGRPYLEVSAAALDADPLMLNVLNGTLVVKRRGADGVPEIQFRAHDPRDRITKLMPVSYDPEAACPNYDAFLEFVQPAPDMRRFLAQWGGYSLTGDASEQLLTFHHGKGKNGKSSLFNVWGHIAGDYGASIAIESFLDQGKARAGGAPTPDLAGLHRVRFLRTSEPERGAKLAEALIKLATGGEPMQVRHLNRDFFKLVPEFKLSMSGNHKPIIRGTDEGIWRRVRLVPWAVTIPKETIIKDFDRVKLYPEAAGVLNRLLAGMLDWLENGIVEPKGVLEATAEYRSDSDPLGRFLAVCTLPATDQERVQSSELHRLFVAWCKANGEREWTATGFGRAMGERGFRAIHSNVNYWLGLKAVKTVEDFVDQHGHPVRGAAAEGGARPGENEALDDVVPI